MPADGKSIGLQLAELLAETGVTQRGLGRLLVGGAPVGVDDRRWRAQTRWVKKVIDGDVVRPTDAKLDRIEEAVGRPGYFKRPAPAPPRAAAAAKADLERRLEEVETRLTSDVVRLRRDLAAAIRRIRSLEQQALGEAPGSSGQSRQ